MYVCVCRGVTNKQIQREMDNGADSFDEIQARLEVATCCGQCRDYALEIMNEHEMGQLAYAV